MLPFPRGTVPAGFLEVDGSTQSAAVYPDLAAYLGGAFNKGNEPEGFFRLPDTRGEFLRGWDHGRGVDPGRGVGSWADDSLLDHQHAVISADAGTGKMPFEANVAGSATGNLGATARTTGSSVLLATLVSSVFAPAAAKGGTETRPRSLAVMWCLKAWNAPVNQGNINVAALAPLAGQATEINLGTIKLATQAEVNAGVVDSVAVTPKKLRWGFSMSFGTNGYIIFPSWLGGLIIQYGSSANTTESVDISFPVAFPNRCVWVAATDYTPANGTTRTYWQFRDLKSTGLNALNQGSFTKGSTGWGNPTMSACPYFAIGY
ncbi:tail fiber protein [Pseudomonas sp. 2hn]|nr:tail fiber protein [Pseudomonas sp. 2hn]